MNARHWSAVSRDPNSTTAIQFVSEALRRARSPVVSNRVGYLENLATGKDVLDVGAVDHVVQAREKADWLHQRIARAAKSVLGLDVVASEVERLNREGYRVLLMDFSEEVPAGTYDLIVCGEIIEHVASPQKIFRSAARILRAEGRIALTTPNPYFTRRILNAIRWRTQESADHIALFSPANIAEMAMREGMLLESYRGVLDPGRIASLRAHISALLRPVWLRFLPAELFCETIIYECVKATQVI